MLILLIAAGAINFLLAEILDALMLMVTVVIVIGISIYQARRTENALYALKQLTAPYATVIRDGVQQRISSNQIVVGDLLLLFEGDRVSADAELIESSTLAADESTLTGESVPVDKSNGHLVFSGTLITRGHGKAIVTSTGTNSQLGKIGKSLQEIPFERSQLQRDVDQLVRIIGVLGLITVVSVITIYGSTRDNWLEGGLAGIAAAMALIPEEFPVILTLFLAIGAWRMSQVKVIARKPSAIEALGSVTVLCVDKTGTLTENRMTVSEIQINGERYDITHQISNLEVSHALNIAALACPIRAFDPMDKAFQVLVAHNPDQLKGISLREYPVENSRLAYIHIWELDGRKIVAAKGAPETISRLCHLDEEKNQSLMEQVHVAADSGVRILAIAEAEIGQAIPEDIESLTFSFVGLALLRDPVRDGVVESIQHCARAGIRTIMITGDHPSTALAIARDISLPHVDSCLTGAQLDQIDDAELISRIGDISVFARVVPEHKLRIVRALQKKGEIVGMTGDGVNDAPALRAADIGIAMGARGTDVAREAASLVITDDNYTSIAHGIERGRTTYANLQKAMSYVVAIHIPIFGLALLPIFSSNWPLILLPGLVAFHEVIIDPACSVVFEEESPDPKIMDEKPRGIHRRIFTRTELSLSVIQGLSVFIAIFALFLHTRWSGRSDMEIRSMTFGALMVANVGLILTNRSRTLTILQTFRQRENRAVKWIVIGALTILLSLIILPPLRLIFDLGAIGLYDWVLILFTATVGFGWYEIYKFIRQKM
jgi:Ca2+-transporting ATPase